MESCENRPKPGPQLMGIELEGLSEAGPLAWERIQVWGPEQVASTWRPLAEFGGASLALACLLTRTEGRASEDVAIAIAVGDGVVRGGATAARASLIARSPMTGRLVQGQVGSDLAHWLALHGHGLLLFGRCAHADAVLRIDRHGTAHLEIEPGISTWESGQRARALRSRFGQGVTLRPGPAAHAGARFANLAAGQNPASFVGRGGMGMAFASLGLAALFVEAPVEPPSPPAESDWSRALTRSPRLIARAQGQRLQDANPASIPGPNQSERHGCRGCPTPCGFVFENPDRARGGARVSALEPLVGLIPGAGPTASQVLLDACNRLGIDAREAGQSLAYCIALDREAGRGTPVSLEALVDRLQKLALGDAEPRTFQLGLSALRAHSPLESEPSLSMQTAQGESTRHAADPVQAFAQQCGVRGPEPLRSYSFLLGDHADPKRVRDLVAPLELPPLACDPSSPEGKAKLLWWHENLIAAVDSLGYCAFSVAGVLADGILSMDQLAQALWPAGLVRSSNAAKELIGYGALTLTAFETLDRRGRQAADRSPSRHLSGAWQAAAADYDRLRAWRFGGGELVDWGEVIGGQPSTDFTPTGSEHMEPKLGRGATVHFTCSGTMAQRLPPTVTVEIPSGGTALHALKKLAAKHPRASSWLLAGDRPIPALMSAGRAMDPDEVLEGAVEIVLLLAVSGG